MKLVLIQAQQSVYAGTTQHIDCEIVFEKSVKIPVQPTNLLNDKTNINLSLYFVTCS